MSGRGWYVHAPVSKALVWACAAATLAALSGDARGLASASLRHVLARGSAADLATSLVAFGSLSELVCGSCLLHTYRTLERQLGSGKFGSLLLFVTAFSWIPSLRLRPGPLPALGALCALYYAYIPPLHSWSHVPLAPAGRRTAPLSDKTSTYVAALYLIFGKGWASVIPSALGATAACLYGSNALPFGRLTVPKPIRRLLRAVLGPLLESDDPRERARQLGGGGGAAGAQPQARGEALLAPGAAHNGMDALQQGLRRRAVAPAPAAAPAAPSEEAIAAVMALGFDRASAEAALQQTGNNPDAAAARLLGL
ncbi:hypothetical protein JKP88DRAFT_260895 [Tribonema minus]|uniref:UBA domain-containing protein n=1 Tax=Tribonema minus TaxID=303371 RepID=A0A835ZL81_9STRA|nr:hypothetical protein JKP88DRAFT_260895 [Tribonema minus]